MFSGKPYLTFLWKTSSWKTCSAQTCPMGIWTGPLGEQSHWPNRYCANWSFGQTSLLGILVLGELMTGWTGIGRIGCWANSIGQTGSWRTWIEYQNPVKYNVVILRINLLGSHQLLSIYLAKKGFFKSIRSSLSWLIWVPYQQLTHSCHVWYTKHPINTRTIMKISFYGDSCLFELWNSSFFSLKTMIIGFLSKHQWSYKALTIQKHPLGDYEGWVLWKSAKSWFVESTFDQICNLLLPKIYYLSHNINNGSTNSEFSENVIQQIVIW